MNNSNTTATKEPYKYPDTIWLSEFSIYYRDPSLPDFAKYIRADPALDSRLKSSKNDKHFNKALELLAKEYSWMDHGDEDYTQVELYGWCKLFLDNIWDEIRVCDRDSDDDAINAFAIKLAAQALRFFIQYLSSIVENDDVTPVATGDELHKSF